MGGALEKVGARLRSIGRTASGTPERSGLALIERTCSRRALGVAAAGLHGFGGVLLTCAEGATPYRESPTLKVGVVSGHSLASPRAGFDSSQYVTRPLPLPWPHPRGGERGTCHQRRRCSARGGLATRQPPARVKVGVANPKLDGRGQHARWHHHENAREMTLSGLSR